MSIWFFTTMHNNSCYLEEYCRSWPAETARETQAETRPGLRSSEVFNGISNNNNNAVRTITRYVHTKHADSSVKIFRETMVWCHTLLDDVCVRAIILIAYKSDVFEKNVKLLNRLDNNFCDVKKNTIYSLIDTFINYQLCTIGYIEENLTLIFFFTSRS